MADASELVKVMKKASVEAVEAQNMVEIVFGTVTSAAPLKISVEQKMTLGKEQLVLSRNVTEHTIKATMKLEVKEDIHTHVCEEGCELEENTHSHELSEQGEITLHNGLTTGEKVLLIRQQGGQKYIVWDRIGV